MRGCECLREERRKAKKSEGREKMERKKKKLGSSMDVSDFYRGTSARLWAERRSRGREGGNDAICVWRRVDPLSLRPEEAPLVGRLVLRVYRERRKGRWWKRRRREEWGREKSQERQPDDSRR